MSDTPEAFWQRECAVTALSGAQVCPRYGMPCWVCCHLHILTGTLRSVTEGRFRRFKDRSIFSWAAVTDGHHARWSASPGLVCSHHDGARSAAYRRRMRGAVDRYWYAEGASALTPTPVTPARKVSDGKSQAEASEEAAGRLPVLQTA